MTPGHVSNHHGKGGLTSPRRSPQEDRRKQPVGFDRPAQELAGSDDFVLSDEFVQCAWTHAGSQRRFVLKLLAQGVVKKIVHSR